MAPAAHLHWGAEALWQVLEPLLPGLSVEVVAQVGSTNTALLDRARNAGGPSGPSREAESVGRRAIDTQPCLLVAEAQTHGRGRQGRPWRSVPGASLTFSLGMTLSPADWSGLSLAVGLALAEALEPVPAGTPRLQLKWPNDLWLADPGEAQANRKLGGVLIETTTVGAQRLAVIGIGLNVSPEAAGPTPSAPDLSSGFACLQELDAAWQAPEVLHRVAPALVRALLAFEHDGFAPLIDRFAARDLLRGRSVTTTAASAPAGVAEGVAADGCLLLRADGRLHRLGSGEVRVRLAGGSGDTV